jgi:hypothetical protein
MQNIIRRLVGALLFVSSVMALSPAWAQGLEIISLRHRMADYVIPQVQPFLAPGAAITGTGEKIFVRTSASNLAQVRELIAALDTPVRRLMISVKSDGGSHEGGAGGGVQGQVRSYGGKVSVGGTAAIYSTDRQKRSDLSAQVQTIDGGRAVIQTGQSIVLPMRHVLHGPGGTIISDTLVQRQVDSGFVALPRVSGQQVTVEISPQMEQFSGASAYAGVESQRLFTTVSGPLGEWLTLGGGVGNEHEQSSGVAHYGTRDNSRTRRVLLKVDLVD